MESGPPHGDEGLAGRVGLVQRVAERLASAVDLDDVASVVEWAAKEGLGASAVTLAVLDQRGTGFSMLVTEGVSPAARERLTGQVPFDAWPPARRVVEERRPLLWSSTTDRARDHPELAELRPLAQSWAVLPLVIQETAIGVLSIGWSDERPFGEVEAALLQVITHQCAVAVDRARIDAVRRLERETLELLSEATRLLVSAVEPQWVPDALVALAVPRLAPWCVVYVAEGRMLRRVSVAIDGEEDLAKLLQGQLALSVDDLAPAAVAFRTGMPQPVYAEESLLRRLYPPGVSDRLVQRTGSWHGVAVPIRAGGESIGAMSLLSPAWAAGPPEQVRFAAEGLASRTGVALVNARRFADERRTAAMLMEAFLPTEIPAIPGFEVAARYLPAGARVAGDWYDVVNLPAGGVLVGIGDAGGHGIPAAALMGQLRNSARGLAMTGQSPAAILDALRLITAANGGDSFATALYSVVDPVGQTVRWSSAGHIPPLRFRPGAASFVIPPAGPPLGAPSLPSSERVQEWRAAEGAVLVTDGVVERRGSRLEEGMAALRSLVRDHSTDDAAAITDRIVDQLCGGAEDDCCVVVLRRT
ncbi:MAG: SpoIIE family protein phosphatase [Acidimicrobiales bacterium]